MGARLEIMPVFAGSTLTHCTTIPWEAGLEGLELCWLRFHKVKTLQLAFCINVRFYSYSINLNKSEAKRKEKPNER